MSNNLVSQQLPVPSMQMGQLEPILNKMDSSISEMQMGVVGSVGYMSGHPVSQPFPASNRQTALISDNSLSRGFPSMEMQTGKIGQIGSMLNNEEQMSAPFKRKTPMEPICQDQTLENMSMSQKRVAQMQHRPWLPQISALNKRTMQLESMPISPGSHNSPTANKKMVKTEFFSSKSGSQRMSSQKNQTARAQPPTKVSTESSESVRSKMREQLATALSLVTQQGNKSLDMRDNSPGEAVSCPENRGNNQPAGSALAAAAAVDRVNKQSNNSVEIFSAQKNNDAQGEFEKILADARTGGSTLSSICDGREFQSSNVLSYDVPFGDNFFVKDELLQGNGLSWVLDSDLDMAEKKEIQNAEEPKLDHEDVGGDRVEQAYQSPQDLAFDIEEELFKLFGGVNKKYKEKGRSLLFNLKDRNNPELRERVVAGEISPERLCSMTAEELASEELSQWRMAKAEELAQMVVLPDSDVDIRRLVRKTHKGEFQVEVDQDDSTPVDISGGSSSLAQSQPKSKEIETRTSKPVVKKGKVNASGENSNLEGHDTSCTLTIPSNEESDFMHGLMVDDGLKDVEFLPPIVSLDEFMESLDSEPPFENLPLDSERMTPVSEKDDSKTGSVVKSSVDASSKKRDDVDVTQMNKDADVKSDDNHVDSKLDDGHTDVKPRGNLLDVKSSDSPLKTESTRARSGRPKGEHVWGGSLQLTVSSTANVVCLYKSGEKTSANEWPGFIEIKGRVRLEAFEKFLQELPLSRSRAVMVVHCVLKESSENERAALQEVADSYVLDERVGFAEPASGVELYFCPPHNKTLEMLGKIIQKEHIEALNELDNGLIGVIVWRKLSSISPKSSSSHHKHVSKKQHFTSRRQQDSPLNSNFEPKSALPLGPPPANSGPSLDDDEDDIPPGFGPLAARDEDDLPEFNFSGGSNPPMSRFSSQKSTRGPGMAVLRAPQTSHPVELVRELIHKYGQNNASALPGNWKDKGRSGVAAQPWNDDDDDIPEWQPQAPQQQVHNFQQQMLRPHLVNHSHLASQQRTHQTMLPLQSLQPPSINATNGSENPALWQQQQQQQGTWWVPPGQAGGIRPSSVGLQPDAGQFYGAPSRGVGGQPGLSWQQNVPKSRGF
ncbi:hypothetical protein TIFTF001_014416 [Ficus carica]|uniref:TFIIS central domain-containing protein n=1 Tax=Ficus carica TaxID=3494 RepID=A0AA88AR96_FICCA|nr:hypothetical protein TIFTF001_014416 [Ficus carica]